MMSHHVDLLNIIYIDRAIHLPVIMKLIHTGMHTVYRLIFIPVLFQPLLPSLSGGEFKTREIPMSQIISH